MENKGSQGWKQPSVGEGRADTKQFWHKQTCCCVLWFPHLKTMPVAAPTQPYSLLLLPAKLSPPFSAPLPHLPSLLSLCPHLLLSLFLKLLAKVTFTSLSHPMNTFQSLSLLTSCSIELSISFWNYIFPCFPWSHFLWECLFLLLKQQLLFIKYLDYVRALHLHRYSSPTCKTIPWNR